MVLLKRTRTSTWLLGACVVNSAVHGGSGYLFPATSFPAAADRSGGFLRQADSFVRGDWAATTAAYPGAVALWAVAPQQAGRKDNSLSMKQKQARRKTNRVRTRRTGPRTDVEGYSHAAFREYRIRKEYRVPVIGPCRFLRMIF